MGRWLVGWEADPEIGVRYAYNAVTHCGFRGIYIDGDLWLPTNGTVEREGNNFDFNVDEGSVVLTDEDHPTYTSASGARVALERWEGLEPSFSVCL